MLQRPPLLSVHNNPTAVTTTSTTTAMHRVAAVVSVLAVAFAAAACPASAAHNAEEPRAWPLTAGPIRPRGTTDAVSALIDRVLGAAAHAGFTLQISDDDCASGVAPPCFAVMAGSAPGTISVTGTGANELAAGLGEYLRTVMNWTIGWDIGGGSAIGPVPSAWPSPGSAGLVRRRAVTWSYTNNVCTNSYSLWSLNWDGWQEYIDWMALSGINNVLAVNGQEEIQYKVFTQLGLKDEDIRSWFNGPSLLTWSRGQNEYGNNINGPLPRSWMQAKHAMQIQILDRQRSLGMVGQLPGFQGNVPLQLKTLRNDTNMTKQGDTAWMDSLDPFFGEIADMWMKQITADFGTDHWYQLDGYFDGSTAPWLSQAEQAEAAVAVAADDADVMSMPPGDDVMAYRRGRNAYMGLNRTDPQAIWSYQGWAFIGWSTAKQAAFIKGFVDATPEGMFNVIDMSTNGEGEWKKWNNASFFGAHFIWTALHDFGGTDGMKGDLAHINAVPFDAMPPSADTNVWGAGATPEGIYQNPVYYEQLFSAPWRTGPIPNLTAYTIERSRRRYQVSQPVPALDEAWAMLVGSAYAQDLSVQDQTGVPHLPGGASQFNTDRHTPTDTLCQTFGAWRRFVGAADAATAFDATLEPFRYDLVNLGRELLAQLSTPASMNFSDALNANPLDTARINYTGNLYVDLLNDVDTLVQTDTAFLLGPWIQKARYWGSSAVPGADDCGGTIVGINASDCGDFYEWNARVQLTTWNPTPKGAAKIPSGPNDYASKHWSGLVGGYYAKRATLLQQAALANAAAGKPFSAAEDAQVRATHAYDWTTAFEDTPGTLPLKPVGDAVATSKAMLAKYSRFYGACGDV